MRRVVSRGFGGLGLSLAAPVLLSAPSCTSVRFFDLKKYKLEKKRLREAELRGETPSDDDDDELPWANEEEQKRMNEEDEARQKELEELTKKMMEERDAEAKLKRQNFKKWRAEQKAKSANAKAALAEAKTARGGNTSSRTLTETVDEKAEEDLVASGAFDAADDIAPANDVNDKRADVHRISSVQKKLVDE